MIGFEKTMVGERVRLLYQLTDTDRQTGVSFAKASETGGVK